MSEINCTKLVRSPHEKIGDIQVLRGLAILMVLFCHLSIGSSFLQVWPVRITMPFYLGVELFFVISGYVITRSLVKDGFNAPRFFIKRVFRLMPSLLCFIGLTLVLNRYVHEADLPESGKALMSVSNHDFRQQARAIAFGYLTLIQAGRSYANGAMWSLSIEDQFYAGVTLLCLIFGTLLGRRRKWTGAVLAVAATGIYVWIAGSRLSALAFGSISSSVLQQYLTTWRFDLLSLGVVAAFVDLRVGERICTSFRLNGPFCAAFLLMVPVTLAAICESPLLGPAPVLDSVGYFSVGLCYAALVLLAANGLAFPASRGPLYRAIKFVGDRSYTYYLFHYPIFIVAWLLFQRGFPTAFKTSWHFAVAQSVTVAALLIPFAEVIYRWIELPLAELGRKLAGALSFAAATMPPSESATAADPSPSDHRQAVELYEPGSSEPNVTNELSPRRKAA